MKTFNNKTYLSQHEFRDKINKIDLYISEEVIKYNYDRYTYILKVAPIRKKKTRKKVGNEAKWFKLNLKEIFPEIF